MNNLIAFPKVKKPKPFSGIMLDNPPLFGGQAGIGKRRHAGEKHNTLCSPYA